MMKKRIMLISSLIVLCMVIGIAFSTEAAESNWEKISDVGYVLIKHSDGCFFAFRPIQDQDKNL